MSKPRIGCVCILLAGTPLASCGTILGTALSPRSGPPDAVCRAFEHGCGWESPWRVPLGIVFSPVAGLATGLGIDLGLIEHGDYSNPPLNDIVRPWTHFPGH